MKMLFLRTDFLGNIEVGGSFSHVRGFLSGINSFGVEIITSASSPLIDLSYKFYEIKYSNLYQNFPEVHSIAHNKTIQKILPKIIEKEKPDFIYQRHSEFVFSTTQIARRYNIPLILEVNGIETYWKQYIGKLYFKNLLLRSEAVQFQKADALMVVSDVLKQDLIKWFNLPEEKIYVNPNGVDLELFSDEIDVAVFYQSLPEELQARWQGKLLCGFVGTFGEWHGVEVLAKSVKAVVAEKPFAHFVLIGDGKLRDTVEKILEADRVSEHVTLLGSVPHELVPKYLSLCDILLSPHVDNVDGSTFFGSPTKLFEYMGLGKSIIASSVGQIKDILQDGKNGILVPQKDEKALAEKIIFLCENPDWRYMLGNAAREHAVEKYSWKENARRVIDVYEKIKKAG